MLQQTFHRHGLSAGMVSAVLFCSLCLGLIPAGCGCAPIGCGPSLQVKFEVSVPQTYDAEVSIPTGQMIRMHCAGNSTHIVSSSLPEVPAMCLWNEGLTFDNFMPGEMTVTLRSGNHRVSQTFKPTYESYQLDGSCGPACRTGKVSFTTPLDTSPKALAQTATARPVMIEVNRALLQATIIDATARAHYSDLAMAPGTATALQVQRAENFATIEAIRPTADSLKIVLMERAVQPTDAPEATLFAQANKAARPLLGTPVPYVP